MKWFKLNVSLINWLLRASDVRHAGVLSLVKIPHSFLLLSSTLTPHTLYIIDPHDKKSFDVTMYFPVSGDRIHSLFTVF